jgi:hypothetical protein
VTPTHERKRRREWRRWVMPAGQKGKGEGMSPRWLFMKCFPFLFLEFHSKLFDAFQNEFRNNSSRNCTTISSTSKTQHMTCANW